jgi:hypothetical protein
MSRAQRLGFLALAVLVAVTAFVVLRPGDEAEAPDKTGNEKTTEGGPGDAPAGEPQPRREPRRRS